MNICPFKQLQYNKKVKRITYLSRAKLKFEPITYKSCLKKSFYSFASATKINGFYYLREKTTSGFIRFAWILILLALLLLAITIIHLLTANFYQNPSIITKSAPASLASVPFPAISICLSNPMLGPKVREFIRKSNIPLNVTRDQLERVLVVYNGFARGAVYNASLHDVIIANEFLTMNNVTVPQLMKKTEVACDDFITQHQFGNQIHVCNSNNCDDWEIVPTINGLCCAFNFYPNDLSKAYALNQFGSSNCISILFSGRISINSSFTLHVHHPSEYVTRATPIFLLTPNYENYFQVNPWTKEPSDHYMHLPLQSRRCLLSNDRNLTLERLSRCQVICITKIIHTECKCHPYFFPLLEENPTIRDCTTLDIPCFNHNTDIWNAKCPRCLPSCFEISYQITSSKMSLDHKTSKAILPIYENITEMENPFTAHIFYGNQIVDVSKQILITTWIDFIANLGGVLNLTLGVSVLSVCEIFYYFIYTYLRDLRKWRKNTTINSLQMK